MKKPVDKANKKLRKAKCSLCGERMYVSDKKTRLLCGGFYCRNYEPVDGHTCGPTL